MVEGSQTNSFPPPDPCVFEEGEVQGSFLASPAITWEARDELWREGTAGSVAPAHLAFLGTGGFVVSAGEGGERRGRVLIFQSAA